MTSLEILKWTFGPVRHQSARPSSSGVYLLINGGEIVYVGASRNVPCRIGNWAGRKDGRRRDVFEWDQALWLALPWSVATTYEHALIRELTPRHNERVNDETEHDAEILYCLGLRDELSEDDVRWEAA